LDKSSLELQVAELAILADDWRMPYDTGHDPEVFKMTTFCFVAAPQHSRRPLPLVCAHMTHTAVIDEIQRSHSFYRMQIHKNFPFQLARTDNELTVHYKPKTLSQFFIDCRAAMRVNSCDEAIMGVSKALTSTKRPLKTTQLYNFPYE